MGGTDWKIRMSRSSIASQQVQGQLGLHETTQKQKVNFFPVSALEQL